MKSSLDSMCLNIIDCEHKTSPLDESGEFFAVGTPAMRGNVIDFGQARRISEDTFKTWTRRLRPQFGDLLFAREAPVGPVVLIPKEENVAAGQRTVLLRPDPKKLNTRFLYYLLSSPKQQRQIESLAAGSTVAHLNVADVRSLEIQVPAIVEQQAIAEVLGALDDKIAANAKLSRTADLLAGYLFDQTASTVPSVPMSEVLTPVLGGTPARANTDFWNGGELWASAKDITGAPFAVILATEEKITQQAVERSKAKPLPKGSVILTARGTVGAVARLAVPSSFNQSCYGFVPNELPPGLLYFSILRAAQHAKSLAHGSVFDTITMRTFDHLLIPNFGEAGAFAEAQIAPLLEVVAANVLENASLATIRDALLPQLMSGKLCVKDAEALVESAV